MVLPPVIFCSCATISFFRQPDLQEKQKQRFETMTGHTMLAIHTTEPKLGFVMDNGVFVKKVWGRREMVSAGGENIELASTRENFDRLRLFLGDQVSFGTSLETAHHIDVSLEDMRRYELADWQPLIEYMGEQSEGLIQQDFVVSMIKVTKFSMRAHKKVTGTFGTEFNPLPLARAGVETGGSTTEGPAYVGYNVCVGCRLYRGSAWWDANFRKMPRVNVTIAYPSADQVVERVRVRVRGAIAEYPALGDAPRNRMRLYLMTRDEYEDDWILQGKATINVDGSFEGIARLGTLDSGDGHRSSITAFATCFDINREVNSTIPHLPFNMGQCTLQVTRKDDF